MLFSLSSCNNFLSEKSDLTLANPTTLQDLEALLHNVSVMNMNYTMSLGEAVSDNIYLSESSWSSLSYNEERESFIWVPVPLNSFFWPMNYYKILTANVVLAHIDLVEHATTAQKNQVRAAALFFRALNHFDLLQLYSIAYDPAKADTEPGVVLRLGSDMDEKLKRNTQAECLQQIEQDLLQALDLLSINKQRFPLEVARCSVYALLVRYYLMIADFEKAEENADHCLAIQNDFLDYNIIDEGSYPFQHNNVEIIFSYTSDGSPILSEGNGRIAPELFALYSETDRRKALFFTHSALDSLYQFTGDYFKSATRLRFNGTTTPEILLSKAECAIRQDRAAEVVPELYRFLAHRYSKVEVDLTAMDDTELLHFVLLERRKELVFRGLRWFDIRRLSPEESGVDQITRSFGQPRHRISNAEIKAFRFIIPKEITDISGIEP